MTLSTKRKRWMYIFERVQCLTIVLLLNPCYFIFHMTVVRPNVVAMYNMGTLKHYFHIFVGSFCFINVTGNMFMAIFTDTSLQSSGSKIALKDGNYCELCQTHQPPKSWHCSKCNVCILKRDHHCFFISRCIGLNNQRYYLLYLIYILISVTYSTYYDYFYISSKFEDNGFIISVIALFNPLIRLAISESIGVNDVYVLFLVLNVGLVVWFVGLVWFHMKNAMRGLTSHERNIKNMNDDGWKKNLLKIFGRRWYLAIFIPFVDSPYKEMCEDEEEKIA